MKPLDPRLMRYARSARTYIILTALFGILTAVFVVAQAVLLGHILGGVAQHGWHTSDVVPMLAALLVAAVARAVVAGAQERYAHRAATKTIADLRAQVLRHAAALGPRWLNEGRSTKLATLLTHGLDALDAYFSKYLPQLLMVATLMPLLLIVVGVQDWVSGLIILITIPVIPAFMILIGKMTQSVARRRLKTMTTLSAQVLDLLAGLPTLKALGREKGPARQVRQLSEQHARATFQTVRVAFLSGAVLELAATISVAVVAVAIGLRLDYGKMTLAAGLAVLIMAPEVYKPIRAVGTQFHASSNGVAAADQAFEVLATPLPEPGTVQAPDLTQAELVLDGVSVHPAGRDRVAPADLNLTLRPGTLTALTGPNGAGKSTAAAVLLGLVAPDRGRALVRTADGRELDVATLDRASWWRQIAWVPQRPAILPGTVWENVTGRFGESRTEAPDAVGSPTEGKPTMAELERAADLAQFSGVVAGLEDGWDTPVGSGGVGLSVGQGQRLALTRALLGTEPVVVLDEPTAHLDEATEAHVLDAISGLARAGRTVLVIAHRPDLIARAGTSVPVQWAPWEGDGPEAAPASDTALATTAEVTR